jgi:hypothetical protein
VSKRKRTGTRFFDSVIVLCSKHTKGLALN